MAVKTSSNKPSLMPRFRVVCGENIALGPGKVELLAHLIETGSLKEAARRLGMSYMRAWKLVQTMNVCFREPVAVSERGGKAGGGMKITATGRRALALYQEMEAAALHSASPHWGRLQKLLRSE
ncbi:MAG: Molybdenum-binding transcriptional regulator, ModE family protein [Pedosphaera sp.]|nr:Molybdenum-binding transcriptional regulator, ModE family protein [Pedosphaera sp.]